MLVVLFLTTKLQTVDPFCNFMNSPQDRIDCSQVLLHDTIEIKKVLFASLRSKGTNILEALKVLKLHAWEHVLGKW